MNTVKLKLFFDGRKGLLPVIKAACSQEKDIIWFHVASFGEFEEARPVIEATRARFPERKILMTVFSPSVYEPMKHYSMVDWVFYLPLDTPWNVRRFLDAVRPVKAIFNIGELWPFLLNELRRRGIDTYIMSVRLEPDSPYFKWYGFIQRQIFRNCYKCVMVHNESSRQLLKKMGVPVVEVVGDARMDRVIKIAEEPWKDAIVEAWSKGRKVFVGGSTYYSEDRMLVNIANSHPEGKFLIIPHELGDPEVQEIIVRSRNGAVRYTDYEGKEADAALANAQILVVNTVGMLARLYRYGYACHVGGGIEDAMPHSVVEPASYGMPVSFGPKYRRELHCKDLLARGAGFPISSEEELAQFYEMAQNPDFLEKTGTIARQYTRDSAGATETIMKLIFG